MYVICDIEWVEHYSQRLFPTQIAAIKVNEKWNVVSCFSSFICPPEGIKYKKKHMAFSGGDIKDFESSKTAGQVFEMFYEWLEKDDILLWWSDQSDAMFRMMTQMFTTETTQNRSVVLVNYVKDYLKDKNHEGFNQYSVANYLQLPITQYKKHFSLHDATVACEVLKAIEYPQDKLLFACDEVDITSISRYKLTKFPYYYDVKTGLIHNNKCEKLLEVGIEVTGYPTLATALRKKYKPCECCKEEYRQALRVKNADTISRSSYNYVFSPNSGVYHKRECRLVLNSTCILGAHTVEAVLKTGRTACKGCNPPSTVEKPTRKKQRKVSARTVKSTPPSDVFTPLPFIANKDELRAVNRQKVAAKERADKLREGLSQDELNNIYALTQPRYAFWAAKGHKHFHLRSCPTMKNLSHLRGFETYQDAMKAHFHPCRKCKPTSKHDLKLSVPIYNQLRENESAVDLKSMCISEGFECYLEDGTLSIITSAGKWKVHTDSIPIKVEHINLIKTPHETKYHKQPRVFLSFEDVFRYIKQHDAVLE